MNNVQSFDSFVNEREINQKTEFGMTTQIQDNIKSLCKDTLHPEALKYHEDDDPEHTYDDYMKGCHKYFGKCINECMELGSLSKNTAGGTY